MENTKRAEGGAERSEEGGTEESRGGYKLDFITIS